RAPRCCDEEGGARQRTNPIVLEYVVSSRAIPERGERHARQLSVRHDDNLLTPSQLAREGRHEQIEQTRPCARRTDIGVTHFTREPDNELGDGVSTDGD